MPHFEHNNWNVIEFCSDRFISKYLWPARLFDLTSPVFLRSYLKGKVYAKSPQKLNEVKNSAAAVTAKTNGATVRRVSTNMLRRLSCFNRRLEDTFRIHFNYVIII